MRQQFLLIFIAFSLFLLCVMMSANGINSRPHPDHSTLQLPCDHPSCQRYFKSAAGRTKHRLSAHPTIPQPVPAPRSPSPKLLDPLGNNHYGDDIPHDVDVPFNDNDQFNIPRPSSPLPAVDTEYFGPGNHLYQNFHKNIDGKWCFALCK